MSPSVKPIPDGHDGVSPYLFVDGAAKAIDYYIKVFKGVELFRMPGPGGKIMHAELRIGQTVVMLADEFPEMGAKGPASYGGSPVMLHLYVVDVDDTVAGAADGHARRRIGATLLPARDDRVRFLRVDVRLDHQVAPRHA